MYFHEHLHCFVYFPMFFRCFRMIFPKKNIPCFPCGCPVVKTSQEQGDPATKAPATGRAMDCYCKRGSERSRRSFFRERRRFELGELIWVMRVKMRNLENLDEGDDAVLFFVLMSILSPVLFFPFAGGCYVDVFSGGITSCPKV